MSKIHQDSTIKTLLRDLHRSMEDRRASWLPYWKEAAELFFQDRAFMADTSEESSGEPRQLFNTAGTRAVSKSTAGFIGATTSRTSRFFRFALTDQEKMKWPGVGDYLELAERVVYAELNRSNFYSAIGELVPNWFVINTASLMIEDDLKRGKINFVANHPKDVLIEEDETGTVDCAIRTVYLSNKAIIQRFGETVEKEFLPSLSREILERRKVWHAILPSDDQLYEAYEYRFPKRFPWVSIWMLPDDDIILDVGGYWEFPMPTGRYSKNTGSVYGRGPGLNAIHEALMANQISKSRLRLSQLTSDPPWLIDKNLQGRDDIIPGNHIYTDGPNESMRALDVGAHYPNTIDTEKRIDQIIYETFNVDMWMALQRSERARTAFEVDAILSEHASILGPMTDRYNTEIQAAAIKRTFAIALRSGRIPPPPKILAEGGAKIVIDFIGYLSQLQRRHFSVVGLLSGIQHMRDTASLFPEALDVVDGDELMRTGLDGHGVSQGIIREVPIVAQIRQLRVMAQVQAQEAQQKAATELALAKRLDPNVAPQEGSIASETMQ